MPRILISTVGSLGDLNPFIGLGCALKESGCEVALATSHNYKAIVESFGLEFVAIGPKHLSPEDPELNKRSFDRFDGLRFIHEELVFPHLRQTYEELYDAAQNIDLIISGSIAYAIPLVAQKRKIPWVSTALQPSLFLSRFDPVVPPQAPVLRHVIRGPLRRIAINYAKRLVGSWQGELDKLRDELGFARPHPFCLDTLFSPLLNLALFDPCFASVKPDWPQATKVCGFIFQDQRNLAETLPADVAAFLKSGAAPIVVTAGTAAITIAEDFLEQAVIAAQMSNNRCLVLAGKQQQQLLGKFPGSEAWLHVAGYCPHSQVFPHAALVLHQAGMGTLAQVLRSGKASLCVPFGADQFDNSSRLADLGCARVLPAYQFNAARAARDIVKLALSADYSARAKDLSPRLLPNARDTAANAVLTILREL